MDCFASSFPDIGPDNVSLFFKQEPLFGSLPFLVFYGSSTQGNTTNNSSRIQAHIYSIGGFRSFPRLTVAPTSPLYAAVNHLPLELQGDDICRGLAISILRYFTSLSDTTKDLLRDVARNGSNTGSIPAMFDEMHAAHLAAGMVQVFDCTKIVDYLRSAIAPQIISWLDIDVLLPPNSFPSTSTTSETDITTVADPVDPPVLTKYEALLKPLTMIPRNQLSSLQRAPSNAPLRNIPRTLSKENKISLRQDMCEFVDTESSYLDKLRDLMYISAPERLHRDSQPVSQKVLLTSLKQILEVDESLYRAVQTVLDETEDDALSDLQSCDEGDARAMQIDATGILPFTRAMAEELSKFKAPYQAYLGAASNINDLLSELTSSLVLKDGSKVSGCPGQQHLKSLLIEPVQRLPRCSLFINNMLQILPLAHAARQPLIRSRDIISDICRLGEDRNLSSVHLMDMLKRKIRHWPQSTKELGTFVTAIDAIDLEPPFIAGTEGTPSMLLLFSKKLLVIRKEGEDSMSSRSLLGAIRQIEHGKLDESEHNADEHSGLSFGICLPTQSLWATETIESSVVYLSEIPSSSMLAHEAIQLQHRAFQLKTPYDARASRLTWEIIRSRLEDRALGPNLDHQPEIYIASLAGGSKEMGLIATISQLSQHQSLRSQYEQGLIRLLVDDRPPPSSLFANAAGAIIVGHLQICTEKPIRLRVESSDGLRVEQECILSDAIHQFRRAVQNLLRSGCSRLSDSRAAFDALVLHALPLDGWQNGPKRKASRPKSPVKLLSNMLGGLNSLNVNPVKTRFNTVNSGHPTHTSLVTPHTEELPSKAAETSPTKSICETAHTRDRLQSSLELLEDSFLAYVVALRSRSGNVVGRILHARSNADELAVNELYNSLLEDPKRLEVTSVVSVDVLFSAFEKFLRVAWRERMGPLLAPSMIKTLQTTFDNTDAKTFRQTFRQCIDEMSPQNRRALAATLKLLSDLLEASGNDSDRGVLIASFAEALVLTGNPLESITLFDRLSEDFDILFEDYPDANMLTTSSSASPSKDRSFNASSFGSNASSLRKRLGLTRSDSKAEPESKVAAIWRTLSKNARIPGETEQSSNAAKTSLGRSRSTDSDSRMLLSSRPLSRDRPPTAGSTCTVSSCNTLDSPLRSTILAAGVAESSSGKRAPSPRKKRRSSLSDLPSLKLAQVEGLAATGTSPRGGSSATLDTALGSSRPSSNRSERSRLSPQRSRLPRLNSPVLKQDSPSSQQTSSRPSSRDADVVTISTHTTLKRGTAIPQLPAPRSGLKERSWPPSQANIPPQTKMSMSPTSKSNSLHGTKIPSSLEKENSLSSNGMLQAEITQIGEELSNLSRPSSAPGHNVPQIGHSRLHELSERLDRLQKQLDSQRVPPNTTDGRDAAKLTSKLASAENKVKQLDALYREANAENEALYERFNKELRKILLRVKEGEGVDELRSQLETAQANASRLRSENANLKRDIAGLRSLQA